MTTKASVEALSWGLANIRARLQPFVSLKCAFACIDLTRLLAELRAFCLPFQPSTKPPRSTAESGAHRLIVITQ